MAKSAVHPAVRFVLGRFPAAGNPERARGTTAYLKTTQPMYGISHPVLKPILREMCGLYPPENERAYRVAIRALWDLPHRECRYAGLWYAEKFKAHHVPGNMLFFREFIVEGAWWDLVDWMARKVVGATLERQREGTTPIIRKWIGDEDLWVRRTAIIAQVCHKKETDTELLAEACLGCIGEKDFFIRKAIGWALRDYSKTNPGWVKRFVTEHYARLSPLSIREGGKYVGISPPKRGAKKKVAGKRDGVGSRGAMSGAKAAGDRAPSKRAARPRKG